MIETEIDADNPARPALHILVSIERPHQAFQRERKHAGDAELRDAVNAGLALMRQVAFLELRAALRADVPGVAGIDADVDAIGAVFVQEPVGQFTAALERCVRRKMMPSVAVVRAINSE